MNLLRLGLQPFLSTRWRIFGQPGEQGVWRGGSEHHRALILAHKSFGDRVFEELQQAVEVSGDVQKSAGLRMDSQLCPGEYLEELLQRAPPARNCDEGVGQLRHRSFPFMHRLDDAQ